MNPTVFSYIVGDVTIELARMVDLAQAGQILVGDFRCGAGGAGAGGGLQLGTAAFISSCNRDLEAMRGTQLSGKTVEALACRLTASGEADGKAEPRRFRIVDKHGLSRHASNLEILMDLEGQQLDLGLAGQQLPGPGSASGDTERKPAPSADELMSDLASMLKKRGARALTED